MRRHPSGRATVVAALAVLLGGICPPSGAAVGPRLEARPEKMDYGSIRQGEEVRKVFLLRNTGDETLVIEQIRPSCAECVMDETATYRIEPGKEVELPVTYRATVVPGKYKANVTLHTNVAADPLARIYLEVEVTARGEHAAIELNPAELDVGLVLVNAPVRRAVKVRNTGTAPLRLDELAAGPCVSVLTQPARELAPGAESEIVLEARGTEAGILRSHVAIATNDPDHATVTVPVYGYVASAQQVERLARGVFITLQPVAGPGRAAVRVMNNQGDAVSVSAPGAERVLTLAQGESGTLEAVPAGAGRGLLIQVVFPTKAEATQSPEGTER